MTHSRKKGISFSCTSYPFNSLSRLESELHATNNTSSYLTFINAYFKTLYLVIKKREKKIHVKNKKCLTRLHIYVPDRRICQKKNKKFPNITSARAKKILLPNFYLICDYLVYCTECGRGLKKRCNTCSR